VQVEDTGDNLGGGQNIGWIEDGDWWGWDPMNLTGIDEISLRAASPSAGATVEVRTGDPEGPTVATIEVSATGAWQTYDFFTGEVSGETATESGPLYFVKTTGQLNVNWVDFHGKGVTENQRPEVQITATPTSGTAPLDVDFHADATDPEDDLPLTYEWTFGDGETADGEAASHTYTEPGTYTARVTVTDARGAQGFATETITVESPGGEPPICLNEQSDAFDGDELNRDVWTTVIRENQDLRIEDGHLVIPATGTDIYGTNNTDTPNIVLQDLPDGPFVATAKLTMQAYRAYQQAGLIIYGDDDNYAKMVLQGRDTSQANPAARIFQFIREENGQPNEVGDSNTGQLGAAYPDTVWVRYISDGESLRAAYSDDGVVFTEMPQTKSLEGIEDPKIGLVSLAGTGNPGTDAHFDYFLLETEGSRADVGPDDDFDGSVLDGCRWDVLRPDPSGYRLANGHLEIDTSDGDIYESSNSDPANFVLQPAPDGDEWVLETKVDGSQLDEQYQQGGLIVYADDANYVKFDYVVDNQAGDPVAPRLELRSEVDDAIQSPQPNENGLDQGVWHLRLGRSGDTYTGWFSADGESWTEMSDQVVNGALGGDDVQVGLFALGGNQQASKTARFDYFRVVEDDPDPTTPEVELTLDPAEPTGDNDWWVDPVTITATATDEGDDQPVIEYRMDDGDWTEYSAPIVIDEDGTVVFEARASNAAGAVSDPESVTVRLDSTAPEVTVLGVEDGASVPAGTELDISVDVEDETSGPGTVTAELNGEALGLPATITPEPGEYLLSVTATDQAGNASDLEVSFEVVAEVTFESVAELLETLREDGLVSQQQYSRLTSQLTIAERAAERGRTEQAVRALDRFRSVAESVSDDEARSTLLDAADALRAHL
jgi:cytochrome c